MPDKKFTSAITMVVPRGSFGLHDASDVERVLLIAEEREMTVGSEWCHVCRNGCGSDGLIPLCCSQFKLDENKLGRLVDDLAPDRTRRQSA